MKVECKNVPLRAVQVLASQLEAVGMVVTFDTLSLNAGSAHGIAGSLKFSHDGEHLTVTVTKDEGHFPRRMLLGGILQMVSEAVEATK